jgi:hypothetical protein
VTTDDSGAGRAHVDSDPNGLGLRRWRRLVLWLYALRQAGTVRSQRPFAQDGGADVYEALRQLAQLRDSGVITSEEFETKKAELLRRL